MEIQPRQTLPGRWLNGGRDLSLSGGMGGVGVPGDPEAAAVGRAVGACLGDPAAAAGDGPGDAGGAGPL